MNWNTSTSNGAVFVALLVVVAGIIGATAYYTFTADRDVGMNVVNDSNGILILDPASTSDIVTLNSEGALSIDVTNVGADGVNLNSTMKIGNPNDPTNFSAFNVTNNHQSTQDVTFDYTYDSSPGVSGTFLTYRIYDSNGNHLATAAPSNSTTVTLSSGQTVHVTINVDTNDLDETHTLSGTLHLKAS